ncbi:MAG: hypothetical protein ACOYOE_03245 [Chlorobium sp.]
MGNTLDLCDAVLTFSEKGKKVKLVPRNDEEAKALVLDGCVFQDKLARCDGMFLLRSGNKKVIILVELKGAHDIPHAFEQLAYVQKYREEYRLIVDRFRKDGTGQLVEKAFIISNGMLSKPDREREEKKHGIRVREVLHCEATSPVPDLRLDLF